MKQLVYDPLKSGNRMTIVCFVSGSGTNYREIVAQNRDHKYVVFTNRPGCGGAAIARENKHEVIELGHTDYLRDAQKKYGLGNVPRNCNERVRYERQLVKLIESNIGGEPDLICLAGYDQWLTDWMVDRYYPRILNVHPGDTTKGYDGLHWLPSAKAIIAGDDVIRSTLFFVDKGEDTGPSSQLKSLALILAASDTLIPEYHKRLRITLSLSVRAWLINIASCSLLMAGSIFFCLLGGDTLSTGLVGSWPV